MPEPSDTLHGPWLIFHGGALGDLVLTIQLALRLLSPARGDGLHVVSRTHPGALDACRPQVRRSGAESLGLHWLYAEHAEPAPPRLAELVAGARVLNTLGAVDSLPHRRLALLAPAALYSLDPRPRPDLRRHITRQWLTDLELQGLLVAKCVHQRPEQRGLGVPLALRQRGAELLSQARSRPGALVIHPGSGGRAKCWSLENFVALARQARAAGRSACFVLGPAELEWWANATLARLRDEFPTFTLPSPDDLSALLAAAGAVVANDSGPAHLAALLGTRTVVLFGPTSGVIWQPLGPDVHRLDGAPQYGPDWGIAVRDVLAALGDALPRGAAAR